MDFDQIMDAWQAQDEKPLYGVNGDLLQLVLRHEQEGLRRRLKREQWITYGGGAGMALLGGAFLWAFLYFDGPLPYAIGAAAGVAAFLTWIAALWLSLHRQHQRERQFGNSLREEVARNLSLLDFQLSRYRSWGKALMWSAPVMIGATLIYWLSAAVNTDTGQPWWFHVWMIVALWITAVTTAVSASKETRKKLEPRRGRLARLLEELNAGN